jgi:hypothetical protein
VQGLLFAAMALKGDLSDIETHVQVWIPTFVGVAQYIIAEYQKLRGVYSSSTNLTMAQVITQLSQKFNLQAKQ